MTGMYVNPLDKELDRLIKQSEEGLARIENGEMDGLVEFYQGQGADIRKLLQSTAPSAVGAVDLQKLSRLLVCLEKGQQIVHGQKERLAEKVAGVRNGRSLARTYTAHP